jgi:hypothetical protein
MKNIRSIFFSILLILFLTIPLIYLNGYSNSYSNDYPQKYDIYRVGCGCCDGTKSKATGRGACSHHGGVKYWIYYDDETKEYSYKSTGRCDD